MITEAERKELQGIVGERWVATDPCILDTYAFYMNPEALNKEGGRFTPRPAAVVMPETTRDVQEVVRFCNRSGLMLKPFSTGFCSMGAPSRDRVITLDLKRMNRIVDIDVKNQIAVVEPYVRAIDLQTRLMPLGLNCHVVSAGGQHSLLASATSGWGTGVNGPTMGFSARNLLGVEWVMPAGEVLTIGSAGSGAGWFTPEGPGPSVRGVFRGYQGAFGGLGVFTKCALKLYRWDGPAEFEAEGCSPDYTLKEMPARIALNAIAFPSSDAMREAGYRMGEAEIEYANFRTPMFFMALGLTRHNEDLKKFLESGLFQKFARHCMANAVVGYSKREFDWKMRAMKEILGETGGVVLPSDMGIPSAKVIERLARLTRNVDDPLAWLRRFPVLQSVVNGLARRMPIAKRSRMQSISRAFWLLIRHANNVQGTLRASQALATTLGSLDTWDLGIRQADWIAREKQDAIAKGLIVDDEGDLGCGGTFEGCHMGYLEGIVLYSAKDPRSVVATDRLVEAGTEGAIENAFGVPISGFGVEANARLGPECGNYHLWLGRIKKALDPNLVSDPYFYAEPEGGAGQPSKIEG